MGEVRPDTETVQLCDEILKDLSERRNDAVIRDKILRIRKLNDHEDARTGRLEKDRR